MLLSKTNLLHANPFRHIEGGAAFCINALNQALYRPGREGEREDRARAASRDFGRNQGGFPIHATDHYSFR